MPVGMSPVWYARGSVLRRHIVSVCQQLAAQREHQSTDDQRDEHHRHQRVWRVRHVHEHKAEDEGKQHSAEDDGVPRKEVIGGLRGRNDLVHPSTSVCSGCSNSCADSLAMRRACARSQRISAPATARLKATSTSRKTSLFHQVMPMPSPPQKVPKVVSITPTMNLSVFSGMRASGARTSAPRPTTSTQAAAAPSVAGRMPLG